MSGGLGRDLQGLADLARTSIASALYRHGRATLFYSGGKDSTVLADLARPFAGRVELVWVNTGAALPHMAEYIHGQAARMGYRLIELSSDQPGRLQRAGLPSRIIPIFNTQYGAIRWREPQERIMLSDPISCCQEVRIRPMEEYVRANHISLVIYGQRRGDNVDSSMPGSETLAPLWDWSQADVLAYVQAHGLELPEQYAAGAMGSFDCWNCTDSHLKPGYIRWLKVRYPELFKEFAQRVSAVYGAVNESWRELAPAFAELQQTDEEAQDGP